MGLFEPVVMPFGLHNVLAVFQRMMNTQFSDLVAIRKVVIYMDNILIAILDNVQEHRCHGRTTLYVTRVSITTPLFLLFLAYHVAPHMDYHRDHFHSFVIFSHPRMLCMITCTII